PRGPPRGDRGGDGPRPGLHPRYGVDVMTGTLAATPPRGGRPANGRGGPRRRVLLVAYQFPPVGGAGVQRVTKFVKYLPRHGWDVSVLTVANPSVPLYDG